mmetsp:Transcript_10550/g.29121  ORF Transcript_10550/g.29121 Transcript_10550/m.29121 type:complete len:92 (-) Transcript_10550:583-858(-)
MVLKPSFNSWPVRRKQLKSLSLALLAALFDVLNCMSPLLNLMYNQIPPLGECKPLKSLPLTYSFHRFVPVGSTDSVAVRSKFLQEVDNSLS